VKCTGTNHRASPKFERESRITNSVTEIFEKRAMVDFYKVQNDNLTANLIDNTYVSQQESSVAVNTFSFGGNETT
jgi:Fe-S cluster assembly protein SufD